MEVGDSFYVPHNLCGIVGRKRTIGDAPMRAAYDRNQKADGKHFLAIIIRENGKPVGVRVWRINTPEE